MKIKLELILDREEAEVIIERALVTPAGSSTYEECIEQYVFEQIAYSLPSHWLPKSKELVEEGRDQIKRDIEDELLAEYNLKEGEENDER